MSLLILTAKSLGALIGYSANFEAVRAAKSGVKAILVDTGDIPDNLEQALILMDSGDFTLGVEQLTIYRSSNDATPAFRVVKELYISELSEINSQLLSVIKTGPVLSKGPAYSLSSKVTRLAELLSKL